uniref:Uncharacterized protein n=1 Tax=Meleagris gallopavo TaxID=9103 RepID=A0A803XP09_MELGA
MEACTAICVSHAFRSSISTVLAERQVGHSCLVTMQISKKGQKEITNDPGRSGDKAADDC